MQRICFTKESNKVLVPALLRQQVHKDFFGGVGGSSCHSSAWATPVDQNRRIRNMSVKSAVRIIFFSRIKSFLIVYTV